MAITNEISTNSTLLTGIYAVYLIEITMYDRSSLLVSEIRTDIAVSVLNSANLPPKLARKIAQNGFHDLSASAVKYQ